MTRFSVFLVVTAYFVQTAVWCQIPRVKLEALAPKGWRVTIPGDGYSYFTFYGKLNEEIYNEDDADWFRNITKPMGGKWVFRDRNLRLEMGDQIYYRTYVVKDGQGYSNDGVWTVNSFVGTSIGAAPAYENRVSAYDTAPFSQIATKDSSYPIKPHAPAYDARPYVESQTSTGGAYPVKPPPSAYDVRPYSETKTSTQRSAYPVNPLSSAYDVRPYSETQTSTRRTTTTPKCEDSMTIVQGQKTVCGGKLIFSEEFEKTAIKDLTNWQIESRFPDEPDYPFNVYMPEHTTKFENGALVIVPVLTEKVYGEGYVTDGDLDLSSRCSGKVDTWECIRKANGAQILPPVITGKINTKRNFAFKYGKVEIRAKLPSGAWLIPELNLEPLESMYGNIRYESGIMRVAFTRGNDIFAKKLYGGPVLCDAEPYRSLHLKEKIGIDNWSNDYHNYSMVWKPDSLELLVDGQQYGTVLPGEGFHASAREHAVPHASSWLKGSIMAPLDQLFYISLGLRVGGINDFSDGTGDISKPWKNRSRKAMLNFWTAKNSWLPSWYDADMKIDYVRVYAL